MQKLRKFLDHVIQLERYICCALLVAIMVICFGAVIMRYVVSKPWSLVRRGHHRHAGLVRLHGDVR